MKYALVLFLVAVALVAVANGNPEVESSAIDNLPKGRPKFCPPGTPYLNVCNICRCGELQGPDMCTKMKCITKGNNA